MDIAGENLYELCCKFASLVSFSAKEKKPEAPKHAPFGEYAWASHREAMPEEPDTAIEKEVYNQLKKHFLTYNREGLPEITALFLSILMELGWYKKVLHMPIHKTLYRGIKIKTKAELAEILGLPENEVEDDGSKDYTDGMTIKPFNGYSTSWTYKKFITDDYSKKDKAGKEAKRGFAVVLIAEAKDNENRFLAGPGGLYDVDGISMYHLEKETVGLEPININRVEWSKI